MATKRDSKGELLSEIRRLIVRNEFLYKQNLALDLENWNLRAWVTILWIILILLVIWIIVYFIKC